MADAPGRFRLITLRSNDQFKHHHLWLLATVCAVSKGRRDVLMINPGDMARMGLAEGQRVALESDAGDGVSRVVGGLCVTPFNLPDGCVGGYYPELNPWCRVVPRHPVQTPAAKAVPVRIRV